MYTLSPDTIKYADALAKDKYGIPELTLMKNAAKACFDIIENRLDKSDRILVLCGKGNNGGDGYELASILKNEGFDVTVINIFGCQPNTHTAQAVYNECLSNGVAVLPPEDAAGKSETASVIIDAVFGVGFYGSLQNDSEIGRLISLCNSLNVLRIAVDTPSGINCNDGRVDGIAFKADITITMAFFKTGMLSYPAREYCGEMHVAEIGYPDELCKEIPKHAIVADDEYIRNVIPTRKPNTHKGTYGRLLMYCSNPEMTGAGILCASAALRSGAGLVNIARDKETIRILQTHLIEPVFSIISEENKTNDVLKLCEKASAVLIGCGLGAHESDKEVLYSLIKNADCPLIIDADGINLLSLNKHILKEAKKPPVLTPHPLEFARLTGKTVSEVQCDRINLAKNFAKEFGCIIVLKGAATVIASPDGRLAINTSGNAGLSKGGSGDVLAGLISSLICQRIDVFDSSLCGVYLHGKAADILKEKTGEYGLLPSDLPMEIAKLLP